MTYLLYLIGFIIALALFLYTLSGLEWKRNRALYGSHQKKRIGQPPTRVQPNKNFNKKIKWLPGERICPLCGSVLTKSDALYSSQVDSAEGQKILILGCRYCYKPEDKQKKSNDKQ